MDSREVFVRIGLAHQAITKSIATICAPSLDYEIDSYLSMLK